MHSVPRLTACLLAALVLVACTDPDTGDETTQADEAGSETAQVDTTGDTDGDTTDTSDTGDTGATGCAAETRDDTFAIGLSHEGALVQASFVSANPAPPIKGDNTWVLEFSDLEGAVLSDLSMVVVPMMPDHGHGTPVNAEVTVMPTAGQYQVTPVNLFMTGYWEIEFQVTLAGGEQDSVKFGFCVE